MTNQATLIDRRKIFVRVAARLEEDILSGRLKPGDSLPTERDLRTQFGVGRPAIREALIKLKEAGLIEITNGVPARVAAPDPANILAGMVPAVQHFIANEDGERELRGVRLFLETALVRHAARQATLEDLESLAAATEANRLAIGSIEDFIRTDIAFHFEFARMADNAVLRAIYDAMSAWLIGQRRAVPIEGIDFEVVYEAHRKIHMAVAARDADAAEGAMRDHLETGWKLRSPSAG